MGMRNPESFKFLGKRIGKNGGKSQIGNYKRFLLKWGLSKFYLEFKRFVYVI